MVSAGLHLSGLGRGKTPVLQGIGAGQFLDPAGKEIFLLDFVHHTEEMVFHKSGGS